ncbi:MFS transporter [Candidatus Epulonipiscium fishelsonii]|uniref:MFS transporter n=1 Tax=Candidatus Epulonipiscium fishelsonii TaxID=77094 RepID=A0ACC8XHZ3_9FIRM|nr:MFS transporter [Epulopiscium sp. SCG-D08WGA-EpuloA1]OON90817.1 MAG: MFS transporter [Epulopiscium sp. AS2M-Bin002]
MFKSVKPIYLYCVILALSAIALGFSDSIFSNYYKDAYQITAYQRGLVEFPRELPGVLCIVLISSLSFLGDIRMAIVAHILSAAGVLLLGLFTPEFNVMLIFLFVNSLGMHMFFPLQDGIAMSLIGKENIGKEMGKLKGISTAFMMIAGIIVFFGFRVDFFSFVTPIKSIFVISGILFIIITILFIVLQKLVNSPIQQKRKVKILFRKEYKYYYILAIMNGVQKQIIFVYGPWVLIDLLSQQTDTLALINIFGSLLGIFFIPKLGKWIDKLGLKKMLFADALSFITIYILYGLLSLGFVSGFIPKVGFPVYLAIGILVLDKLSMQMSIIRVVYLKSISIDPSDITPTLSLGISMDHIVAITCAYLCGIIWSEAGPHYIFFLAAAFSLVNLYVAFKVQDKPIEIK